MGCGTLSSHAVQSWRDGADDVSTDVPGSRKNTDVTSETYSPASEDIIVPLSKKRKNGGLLSSRTPGDISEPLAQPDDASLVARHNDTDTKVGGTGVPVLSIDEPSREPSSGDVVNGGYRTSEVAQAKKNSSSAGTDEKVAVAVLRTKESSGDGGGGGGGPVGVGGHQAEEPMNDGLADFVNALVDNVTKAALLECYGETAVADQSVPSPRKKEKRAKEAQKRTKKKESKSSVTSTSGLPLEDYPTSQENRSIPHFVYKCVSYIEAEGLKTEGLYRIPGNKAQGELFLSQYAADPNVDISTLEIPVNAIATLLKSFFSDLSEALIPSALCDELLEAAEMTDKSSRLLMLRGVIKKLPNQNVEVLKFVISHLYKVSEHQEYNSMNSGNLAKCWWPTLIRLQFKTYEKMVQYSQVPEDIVQTLIEQCYFFFYGGNEV